MKQVDHSGMVSGTKVNRVEVCRFNVFCGKPPAAPLVEECPVNPECAVEHVLDLGSHPLVIGRIDETHVSASCLTAGQPDVNKIKPLVYATGTAHQYLALGKSLDKVFSVGKEIRAGG